MKKSSVATILLVALIATTFLSATVNATTEYIVYSDLYQAGALPKWYDDTIANLTSWDFTIKKNALTLNATTATANLYVSCLDTAPDSSVENGSYVRFQYTATTFTCQVSKVQVGSYNAIYTITLNISDAYTSSYTVRCRSNKISILENGTTISDYSLTLDSEYTAYMCIASGAFNWQAGYVYVEYGRTTSSTIGEYIPLIMVLAILGGALGLLVKKR